MTSQRALALILVAAGAVAAAPAQEGLRLTRVPDRVVLPPKPGSNLLVEVTVAGEPARIWLARDRDQIGGVPLVASGRSTWQINLADPRVLRLMPADRAEGTFRVFARIGGQLAESTDIAWTRAEVPAARVKCFLVGVDGRRRQGTGEQVRWLDPGGLERIEIHGTKAPQARAVARAGTTDLPLTWRERQRQFVLELNDGLRKSMQESGALAIEVRVGAETVLFDYHVVPDRLEPVDDPAFLVMQRRSGPIPGSRGWLEVRLDDITMGRVLLSIVDAEGRVVAAPRLVGDRDGVGFALAAQEYTLRVDKLVNRLIGDDHAELSVMKADEFEPDVIAELIRRVEAAAGITFVREGKNYGSAMAAQLLRARLGSHRGRRPTPAEFVVLAGRSSTTGNPYHVRTKDGRQVEAEKWLGELVAEIEAERKKRKKTR